jgi:hypothetical protein
VFLEHAMPLLGPDADAEARHNLILGIAGSVIGGPGLFSAYRAWLAIEDGRPLAAASRTPPFNAVLADPVTSDALDAVVDAVVDDDAEAPGFIGNLPRPPTVERWAARTGAAPGRAAAGRLHAPRRRRLFEAVGRGAWRRADQDLLVGWLTRSPRRRPAGRRANPDCSSGCSTRASPPGPAMPATGCGRTRVP